MVENSRYRQKRRTPITFAEFQALEEKIVANSESFRVGSLAQESLVAILYYSGLRIAEVVGDSSRRWKVLTEQGQNLANNKEGLPENWMEVEELWKFKRRGELQGIMKEDISFESETLFIISDPLKHGKREEPLEIVLTWPHAFSIWKKWNITEPKSRVWPISQTTARMILRGSAKMLYPHAFRASLASNMARDPTMSVSDLMGWFGWARSSTADAYIMAQRSRVKARESIKKMVEN